MTGEEGKTPRILITGAGGSIAVNLTRSLKMASIPMELYGCDASPYFRHLAETKECTVIPAASDPEQYLSAIRGLCQEKKIQLIIPSNVSEILVLKENEKEIPARLFLPSLESIRSGADKWRTYEVLRDAGLDVPDTLLIESESFISTAFQKLGTPVWFRGRGIPGRGVGVASLPAQSVEQAKAWVEYHDAWNNMTAAEYLPGDNLTWMGLWKNGTLISSQGRKRLSYVISHVSPSGVTGAPSISCTINDKKINRLGEAAMRALDSNYTGVGFVDFKCDGGGQPSITEVNVGRFGTTHHFYTVAGANFPEWYVRLALDLGFPNASKYNVVDEDLYWIRTLDAGPALVRGEELEV